MKIKLYSFVMFLMFITTTAFAATPTQPIPDTGISKCYSDTEQIPCPKEGEAFYGQDGNYSINPMSYTKLDSTGKDLPITATAWAMVKDNVTGLIWENNSHESTWDNAPNVIAELNTAKFGGYSDWRLPTMTELGSIVDFSIPYPGPTINTSYFKDTVASFYWSSSTDAHDIGNAWGVAFYYGRDSSGHKDDYYYVRAVRSGQSVIRSFDPLVINGDRIVSDNTTGLMWQQDTAKTATGGTTMVWKDALSYCENLTLGGYTDWRLPTVKELRSIVDYTVYSPAIDTSVFKDTVVSFYWSSSTYAGSIGSAWGVYFGYGGGSTSHRNDDYYVRAVRSGQLVIGSFGYLTISPTNKSVSNSAGSATFSVSNTDTSSSTMAWTASVTFGGDWLSITSGSSGSNSGTITCSYSANTTTSARTGTIRVTANGATGSPQDLTVVQASGGSKPTVQTGAAGAVATNSATLNGTINPNGTSTTYYFQYGTTTSYGKVTPGADAGSGTTVKSVSANITGLTANTLYHLQLVGTNTAGTVYGGDKTFTTLDNTNPGTLPTLALSSASGAQGSTVTVNLTLTNVAGTAVAAIATDIAFDSTILETPTAVIGMAGTAAGKDTITFDMIDSNTVRIALFSLSNTKAIGNGVAASITFKIKSTAANGSSSTLTQTANGSDQNGNPVAINGTQGKITVNNCKLGDCNCNGVVTIDEVQTAINMLLSLKTVQPCCDRDGNGAVSIAEVQTIINNFRGIEVKSTVDRNELADKAVTRNAAFTSQDAFTRESALTPTLTLESKSAFAGSTVKLALTLANQEAEITSLSTDIVYDVNLFESATAEIGEAGTNAGKTIFSNDAGGKLTVGLISMTSNDIINDGVVAYITLKAKADATGTASIKNTASASDESGTPIEITGNTAQISFGGAGQERFYEVLTPQSPDTTIYNGESVKVFGYAGVNTITVKSGGKVECVNFPGANVVNIEDSASGFTVRRSGAAVYLNNATTGTLVKIPATKTLQTLTFAGGVSYALVISNDGKVKLGSKVVGLTELQL